ncbi:MAG: DUF1902 domain-containing protein [Paucibacter sp.]|nr:DUF1902 domain-containing protein [Roseateles sp.]
MCQQCLKLIFASLTVWVASSGEVPGLATEATTVEALATKPTDLVPLLLEANGCTANWPLAAFGA